MEIRVNLDPLEATTAFPYLVRTVTSNNSNQATLYKNLSKDQRRWGMVEKLLGKMGSPIEAQAMMYKELVYLVVLYGREICVVIDAMMTVLEVLHHRIERRIVGMT